MNPLNTRFLTVLISLVFIGFTVCALAAKPFCGDGVCRKNETVNSCPLDCDSGDGGEPPSGNLEPVYILAPADAGTNSLSVHWLAPDGAARYDVRYSTAPFDFEGEGDFSDWGDPSDAFSAAEPGAHEYFTVRGLEVDVEYHVGVQAIDADGNRSALTDMSFISDVTRRTAQPPNPDIWGVDTVVEVPESAEGTSVVFDNGGSPVVAWIQKNPNEVVRYAYQDGDGWLFELVRQKSDWAGLEFGDNFGLAHQPEGLPGESFPAVIFRERTPRLKKKRGHSERGTYYGYRRGANDWAIEEIVRGELRVNGGQGGAEESLEFFWDDDQGWTPTVSYVVHPLWEDPETTAALVLAERDDLTGEWIKSQPIECAAPVGIYSTELRRGANGDLHVMMSMSDDDGDWVLVAHRNSSGVWNYARTDRTEGVYVETFAVDAQDRYYLAGTRRQDIDGQSQTDVVLLDDDALAIIIDLDPDPCDRPLPGATLGGKYEIVDTPDQDIFANGEADGMLVDTLPDGRVYEVRLTGGGPTQDPAVHLFANRRGSELVEARVFSRCDGPASGWIRDMVDRPHSINSRTVAVSETAMAWSFNLGQRYGSLQSDRVLIAQRVGNACSPP